MNRTRRRHRCGPPGLGRSSQELHLLGVEGEEVLMQLALLGDERPSTAEAMARYPWVLERHVRESRYLVEQLGLEWDALKHMIVDTNALALSAVRTGLGLSVQSAAIVGDDIEQGRLIALTEPVEDDLGYYMVTLKARETEAARKFMRWILRSAG